MLAAAERIEAYEADIEGEVTKRLAGHAGITPEAVEAAMGASMLPWQKKKLWDRVKEAITGPSPEIPPPTIMGE